MFCSQIGSELPSSAKSTVKKSLKRRGFLQIWSQAAELLEDIQSQRFLWKTFCVVACVHAVRGEGCVRCGHA